MPHSAEKQIAGPWAQILEPALRTPSPHNTQPWRVRIQDARRASLYMQRNRMLPDEDKTGHFLLCAMGMFLESVRLLAANAGYQLACNFALDADDAELISIAELTLAPGAEHSGYANELWETRRTSRLPSNGVSIAPDLTRELQQLLSGYGQRYFQFDDNAVIEQVIQENIRAVFHDLNLRDYHDEIARWFRYSDREAATKADGLHFRCMNMPASELRLMRSLPQVMRWPLTRDVLRRHYRQRLGRVTHIGVIAGPFFENAAAMQAGAFLMRFWLELAARNLVIHPFGNLVTNAEAKGRVQQLTNVEDVWLVFRIGYTAEPPRSARLPLRGILLD